MHLSFGEKRLEDRGYKGWIPKRSRGFLRIAIKFIERGRAFHNFLKVFRKEIKYIKSREYRLKKSI